METINAHGFISLPRNQSQERERKENMDKGEEGNQRWLHLSDSSLLKCHSSNQGKLLPTGGCSALVSILLVRPQHNVQHGRDCSGLQPQGQGLASGCSYTVRAWPRAGLTTLCYHPTLHQKTQENSFSPLSHRSSLITGAGACLKTCSSHSNTLFQLPRSKASPTFS